MISSVHKRLDNLIPKEVKSGALADVPALLLFGDGERPQSDCTGHPGSREAVILDLDWF